MGVSGCGKTTLGKAIASRFKYTFLEGDTFHPKKNVSKMKAGFPLNDQDRLPWLKKINAQLKSDLGQKQVLACSALKNEYRMLLSEELPVDSLVWVYLHAEFEVLKKRMEKRTHFMPVGLLQSQLDTLEPPIEGIKLDSTLPIEAMIEQLKPQLNAN
jgi:carbohydrate kinase (thermoresistant glucokinase family)